MLFLLLFRGRFVVRDRPVVYESPVGGQQADDAVADHMAQPVEHRVGLDGHPLAVFFGQFVGDDPHPAVKQRHQIGGIEIAVDLVVDAKPVCRLEDQGGPRQPTAVPGD